MSENEAIKAKTAFIVLQSENGAYFALNSLDKKIEIERPASLQDIKIACGEVRDAIVRADITNSILTALTPKVAPEAVSEVQELETSAPEAQ